MGRTLARSPANGKAVAPGLPYGDALPVRAVAASLVALAVACGGPEPPGPDEPAYPGAELASPTAPTVEELGPGAPDCPAVVTVYAAEAGIEEVVAFHEGQGFVSTGDEEIADGALARWVGIREGEEDEWRRADIATIPEGTTVDLFAPDCDRGAVAGEPTGT